MRLSDIPEHEIRQWCSCTGCWAPWRDLSDLFKSIDAIPYGRRAQWVADQEVQLDQMNLGPFGHRNIAKALAAGANTVVGKAIAEHDCVSRSSSLAYWLSRSVVPASSE